MNMQWEDREGGYHSEHSDSNPVGVLLSSFILVMSDLSSGAQRTNIRRRMGRVIITRIWNFKLLENIPWTQAQWPTLQEYGATNNSCRTHKIDMGTLVILMTGTTPNLSSRECSSKYGVSNPELAGPCTRLDLPTTSLRDAAKSSNTVKASESRNIPLDLESQSPRHYSHVGFGV